MESERLAEISVVIPTVARESLWAAVDSALRQTLPPLEVIVCNDSLDAVNVPDDPRVIVLSTGPRLGGNAARQAGIVRAKGQWIALLDDDDAWEAAHLETVARHVLREETGPWIASTFMTTPAGRRYPQRRISSKEDLVHYLFLFGSRPLSYGWLPTSTMVFERSLALSIPWRPEQRFHQDPTWLLDVYRQEPRIQVIQVNLALVRGGASSSPVSKNITVAMSIQWARENILDCNYPARRAAFASFLVSRTPMRSAARRGEIGTCLKVANIAFREGKPTFAALIHALLGVGLAVSRAVQRIPQGGTVS